MVKYLLFIMRKNYLQIIRVFKIREKMIRVVSKLEKFYLVNLVNAFFIVNFIFIDIYSNDCPEHSEGLTFSGIIGSLIKNVRLSGNVT